MAQRGFHKHVLDHPTLLRSLFHLFRADSHEVNAAAASLVAALKPTASLFAVLPFLARILNFESESARLDAARALHGLITSPELFYDIKEHNDEKLIDSVIHHMHGNPCTGVRELCTSMLATLSALSSTQRVRIMRSHGLHVLLGQITDDSAAVVSNTLTAIMNMAQEQRALNVLKDRHFDDTLATISAAQDGSRYNTRLRHQAGQALNRFTGLAKVEPAARRPIRELTTERDLAGLSRLFCTLPTTLVCRVVCRVSRAWRAAAARPETWRTLDLRGCAFMSDERLAGMLRSMELSGAREVLLAGCRRLGSTSLTELSVRLPQGLRALDLTDCRRCHLSAAG
jgi:hypothetical protein